MPLLLDAWRLLRRRNAELWIVGYVSPGIQSILPKIDGLRFFGPVSHCELPRIMRQCDAFVFPSYFEGFGLVLLEAMASGLPIISTTATAAPDLLCDGCPGFVNVPGDLTSLVESMSCVIDRQADLPDMSVEVRKRAERFTWQAYGDTWKALLDIVRNRAAILGH